jgi:hypothetical protein
MHEVLFIKYADRSRALAEVARDVFLLLDLVSTEERESSSYLEGHYFVGYASNVSVKVCHSDGGLPEFPYWVVLANPALGLGTDVSLDTEPSQVAKTLAERGFGVFVPSKGWARKDWNGEGERFGR